MSEQITAINNALAESESWLHTHRETTKNLAKYESELNRMLNNVRQLQLLTSQTSNERSES